MEQSRKSYSGQYYLLAIAGTAAVFTIPSLPGGFFWFYFFTPLPVIYYLVSLGFDRGLKIVAYAALITGALTLAIGNLQALLFSFSLLPTGIMLARSINRQENIYRAGLTGIISLGLTWLALGIIFSSISHVNLYTAILKDIDTGLTKAYETYTKSPDFPVESKAELQAVFTKMRQLVPRIFPGSLMVSALCTVWLNMTLANWLLKRQRIRVWDDFHLWRLPEPLIWLLIGGGLLLFAPGQILNTVGINVVLILGALHFFQGLAVMASFMEKWSVPRPIKFFIFFIITIQAYGIILLAFIGIVDIWADFRKLKSNDTEI